MKHNLMHLTARRTAAIVLSGALLASSLGVPSVAFAQPSNYEQAIQDLDDLQMELAQSEAVLGKTTYELAETKSNIAELEARMSANTAKLTVAKGELAKVVEECYKLGGEAGLLEYVLSSESIDSLLSRTYYANRLASQRVNAINTVNNLQTGLKTDLHVLKAQQEQQESLLTDQLTQFTAMQEAANRQAAYVSSLSSEVIQAMEQDRLEATIASLETAAKVLSIQTAEELPSMTLDLTKANAGAPAQATPATTQADKPSTQADTPTQSTEAAPVFTSTPTEEATPAQSTPAAAEVAAATSASTATVASTSSNAASGALAAVEAALAQVGKPYGHENNGSEWDCNGLTNYAWSQAGVDIPYPSGTYAYGQFQYMRESDNWVTSEDDLKYGDLVFYSQDGGDTTYHVAMYIGDGQIVHAVGYSQGVQVTDLDYVSGFVGGGTPAGGYSDAQYADYDY